MHRPDWFKRLRSVLPDVPHELYPEPLLYWRARTLRILAAVGVIADLSTLPAALAESPSNRVPLLSVVGFFFLAAVTYVLTGRGVRSLTLASWIVVPIHLTLATMGALRGNGLSDACIFGYFSAVPVAGLLLGMRGVVASTGFSVGAMLLIDTMKGDQAVALSVLSRRVLLQTEINTLVFLAALLLLWNHVHRKLLALAVERGREQQAASTQTAVLKEVDQQRTAFFGNISHELRTPLSLVLRTVEDALDEGAEPLPPRQRQRLDIARRNGRRMLKVVNALLDFAQSEAGRIEAAFTKVDLSALTRNLASEFRAAMELSGLRFLVDCPQLPGPVYVDRGMWEKIVLNLLSNALKFTFTGEVSVSLRQVDRPGPCVKLAVRDTGTGIPARDLLHLFQRFHRVRGARARSHEGSGIGLCLVRELCRVHGGTIEVASTEGQGSVFTVTLPVGAAHLLPERVHKEPSSQGETGTPLYVEEALRWLPDAHDPLKRREAGLEKALPGERPRILVVEDSADMRTYLFDLLSERYAVTVEQDGATALAAMQKGPPDLLLTDVMMPEVDGIQLVRSVRKDPRTRWVPVIVLSARADEASAVEGLRAGADDYLVKPFSTRELLARISGHLELSRMRREASEAKDRFIHMVSHELRGPLSVITGYMGIFRLQISCTERPDFRSYLAKMERATSHMLKVVDDMVDVTRIEAGRLQLETRPCDLCLLCREAADDQETTTRRQIVLMLPQRDVVIDADPQRIGQVLNNLLTNAIKYSPADRPVALGLILEGDQAIVSVRDGGPGIPAAQQPYLFDPFYRVPGIKAVGDSSARGRPGEAQLSAGLGLGLYICRELVKRQGGRIWVQSTLGEGSTFYVSLPLHPHPPTASG